MVFHENCFVFCVFCLSFYFFLLLCRVYVLAVVHYILLLTALHFFSFAQLDLREFCLPRVVLVGSDTAAHPSQGGRLGVVEDRGWPR